MLDAAAQRELVDMLRERAREQRAHLRKRIPCKTPALAVHALGQQRNIAAELQQIAHALFAP